MKKIVFTFLLCIGMVNLKSQTTALDFNRIDCKGNSQHLFSMLEDGNAVILEFFMENCTPCITAGNKIEQMKSNLLQEFPGKIKSFAIAHTDFTTCQEVKDWVLTNGFASIPMDSGSYQVAYYGGMGMPTIVALGGGFEHKVLGSPFIGFSTSDTTLLADYIRQDLTQTSISNKTVPLKAIKVFPNPIVDEINLEVKISAPGTFDFDIHSLAGKLCHRESHTFNSVGTYEFNLDTGFLKNGSYILNSEFGAVNFSIIK